MFREPALATLSFHWVIVVDFRDTFPFTIPPGTAEIPLQIQPGVMHSKVGVQNGPGQQHGCHAKDQQKASLSQRVFAKCGQDLAYCPGGNNR